MGGLVLAFWLGVCMLDFGGFGKSRRRGRVFSRHGRVNNTGAPVESAFWYLARLHRKPTLANTSFSTRNYQTMLVQLTYASRTATILGPGDVKDILQSSARNNQAAGVTGALCLANGIFLQQLEGDRQAVNTLYHRILKDPRHKDPAVLDLSEIAVRQFGSWSMGLIAATQENRQLFLKYSSTAEFDPYKMSANTLRGFFSEVIQNARWLS